MARLAAALLRHASAGARHVVVGARHVGDVSRSSPVSLAVTALPPTGPPSGPPLVFLHGLLGSATNFGAIQRRAALKCGRPTLAVDLRNHGRSPHTPGASSLLELADDVAAAVAAHCGGGGSGGAVDVVGHSLGGKAGMVLALTRPALVRRLVVVDIAPVAYGADPADAGGGSGAWRDVSAVVRAAHKLDPSKFRSRQAVDAQLAEAVADAGVRSFVCQNLMAQPDGTYRWRMNTAALLESLPGFASFPSSAELEEARCQRSGSGSTSVPEVHFISGERSSYVREKHHARIRELFPAAVLHAPVKQAGHWVHADQPAEFWSLLARVLGLHEAL